MNGVPSSPTADFCAPSFAHETVGRMDAKTLASPDGRRPGAKAANGVGVPICAPSQLLTNEETGSAYGVPAPPAHGGHVDDLVGAVLQKMQDVLPSTGW